MFVRLESSTGISPLNELLLKCLYKGQKQQNLWVVTQRNLRLSLSDFLMLKLTDVSLFSSWKRTLVLVLWYYFHLSGTCSSSKDSLVRSVKGLKVCFHSAAWPTITGYIKSEEGACAKRFYSKSREMIDYQVGPTYKSTRDDICPISFGIGPLILFHMKSLHEKTQHFSTTWCDKKKDIEGLKLTISRDELIFGDLVIKSRRDSYSSAGCLITKKKKRGSREGICYRNSWSCPQRKKRDNWSSFSKS